MFLHQQKSARFCRKSAVTWLFERNHRKRGNCRIPHKIPKIVCIYWKSIWFGKSLCLFADCPLLQHKYVVLISMVTGCNQCYHADGCQTMVMSSNQVCSQADKISSAVTYDNEMVSQDVSHDPCTKAMPLIRANPNNWQNRLTLKSLRFTYLLLLIKHCSWWCILIWTWFCCLQLFYWQLWILF